MERPLAGALVVAGLVAMTTAAACGYDGRASASTSSADAEPGPSGQPDSSAPAPPAPSATSDAGPEASTPIPVCTDPALSFDGVDDLATVPDDAALDLTSDFTVEAWIKPSAKATGAVQMDIVSHHDAAGSRGWVLLVVSGRVELVVWGTDIGGAKGYSAGNQGAAYVVPGKWAHVAGTLSGGVLRVYYDGALRDSQTLGITFGRDTFTGALRFGRAAGAEDSRFQGQLDDVRLSNIARYTGNFAAKPVAALGTDDSTVAAWRFDEPSGSVLVDTSKHNHDGSLAPDKTAATRVASPCIMDR